jgi:hypothetical protein
VAGDLAVKRILTTIANGEQEATLERDCFVDQARGKDAAEALRKRYAEILRRRGWSSLVGVYVRPLCTRGHYAVYIGPHHT